MTCENEMHLRAYLDRALDPAQSAELKRHLRSCKSCADKLARVKQSSELFRQIRAEKAPAGFEAGVMAAIRGAVSAPESGTGRKTILSAFSWLLLQRKLAPACGLAALALISFLSIKAVRSANRHDRIVQAYFENRRDYAFPETAARHPARSYDAGEPGACRWSSCSKNR